MLTLSLNRCLAVAAAGFLGKVLMRRPLIGGSLALPLCVSRNAQPPDWSSLLADYVCRAKPSDAPNNFGTADAAPDRQLLRKYQNIQAGRRSSTGKSVRGLPRAV